MHRRVRSLADRWHTRDHHRSDEENIAMPTARGRFEVRRSPQGPLDLGSDAKAMHLRFDKTFEGPLTATSVVHMIAVGACVEGSAGYVAVERIDGRLDGREGAFAAMHFGVMDRGTPSLRIEVVPDSGEGQLEGLTGTLAIDIVDGEHFYTFDYDLTGA
jgi:hypothetical protein